MLGLIVRLLAILLFLRLAIQFIGGLLRGLRGPDGAVQRPPSRSTGMATDLVRDPVCNTFVPRGSAIAGRLDGRDVFFCSRTCRDKAASAGTARPN
jgi:YHS domain-containing protein